jgi:hypothetical protein
MKLSLKGLAAAAAITWGGCFFLVALANLMWPPYGESWLQLGQSIYPGYTPGGFGSVIVVTLYALLDGAVVGAVFGWIYNRSEGSGEPASAT